MMVKRISGFKSIFVSIFTFVAGGWLIPRQARVRFLFRRQEFVFFFAESFPFLHNQQSI